MKQFVAAMTILALHAATAGAQTFTERLQKKAANQATVTIHQDAAIDELVNGTSVKLTGIRPAATTARPAKGNATHETADKPATGAKQATAAAKGNATRNAAESNETATAETHTPDTRKKVMVGGYKVNGYRVQAFAGGNTRRDRQQAERIGNEIKARFPDQPIYVHFYSPRWICRVGNYRTYEEAHQMLTELQKLGYKQALIVKGKITIQY